MAHPIKKLDNGRVPDCRVQEKRKALGIFLQQTKNRHLFWEYSLLYLRFSE